MHKYIKIILLLLPAISIASIDSQTVTNKTANFNFKNLSGSNSYYTQEYGIYNPENAINTCSGDVPPNGIWPSAADLPKPEPTPSDCEIGIQMGYGCNNFKPGSIGAMLEHSIVGIEFPNGIGSFDLTCSGVIIDREWVLTAAHCIADPNTGRVEPILDHLPLYISPRQLLLDGSYGVPLKIYSSDSYIKFEVVAAYFSKKFGYNLTKHPSLNSDIALLKLKNRLPDNYIPIPISSHSQLNHAEMPVWMAGYGFNENQIKDGQLRYRQGYFMTNTYNSQWRGGVSGNYGNIYTLSSKPELYHGEISAWSFLGKGDSGGPILSYDMRNQTFHLEGITSSALFCDYAGYFAKLPYPYSVFASTTYPEHYNFIKNVMNGTIPLSDVNCVSPRGECRLENVYVLNQNDNTVSSYKQYSDGRLEFISSAKTGDFSTQIEFYHDPLTKKYYAYITNYLQNTISIYSINSINGALTKIGDQVFEGGVSDIKIFGSYAYVTHMNTNFLGIYAIKPNGLLEYQTREKTEAGPSSINMVIQDETFVSDKNYLLVINYKAHSISFYKTKSGNTSFINSVQFPDSMGDLLEISAIKLDISDGFYLLTTSGVYIYHLYKDQGKFHLTDMGHILQRFDIDSHIIRLDNVSFAVSNKLANTVNLYAVGGYYRIRLENTIKTPSPSGMTLVSKGADSFLYISNYNERSISSYKIYPDLSTSASAKYYEAGNGASIIKSGIRLSFGN